MTNKNNKAEDGQNRWLPIIFVGMAVIVIGCIWLYEYPFDKKQERANERINGSTKIMSRYSEQKQNVAHYHDSLMNSKGR